MSKEIEDAARKLLARWDEFNASGANYEQAYYRLAKFARGDWEALRSALSASPTK